MSDDAQSWIKVLGSAGVIALVGRACESLFRWFVRRPLEKAEAARARAERDADHWHAQYLQVAAELKANTTALLRAKRADEIASGTPPDSLPPMRDEMPTLQCFVDGPQARAWAEERERTVTATPQPVARRTRPAVEAYALDVRPTDPAPAERPGPRPLRPPRPRTR